jgi:hypothetical protein
LSVCSSSVGVFPLTSSFFSISILKFYWTTSLDALNSCKSIPSNGATYFMISFICFLQSSTDLSFPDNWITLSSVNIL